MSTAARTAKSPIVGVIMSSDISSHPRKSWAPRDWLPAAEEDEIARIDASRIERKVAIDRVADAQIAELRASIVRKAALRVRPVG